MHAADRFKDWFVTAALPLWAARSYDDERGGFYETLDFNGAPVIGQPRRVRVQARQIHTFSAVAMRDWHKDAEALAAKGFEYFLENACPDGGARGCVHTLSDDGVTIDDKRDLYDQAFLLLACSARWAAAKDDRALVLAEKTIAFLDRELASPHGGWLEDDRGTLPRRQNPHMHLFEAFMALYEVTDSGAYLHKARDVYALFEQQFFDPSKIVIREFFDQNLTPAAAADYARIEPGHMMEWVWLLGKYDALAGSDNTERMQALFAAAKTYGRESDGFLADSKILGAPITPTSRRLWPQTEYIKAALTLASRGHGACADDAFQLIERLFQTYLDQPVRGLWCDQYDRDGAPVCADVPASILYHLFEAVAETIDKRETISKS